MAELKIFYKDKDKDKIKVGRSVNILSSLDKSDIIWIDLLDVSDRTEGVLEDFLKIDIQESPLCVASLQMQDFPHLCSPLFTVNLRWL